MRGAALPLLPLLLVACPKPSPTPDWSSVPTLPSPTAEHFVRVQGLPRDPVVASLVDGLRWDESLSGAAAGLALAASRGEGGLSETRVREALLAAGYPYPIEEVRGWTVDPESPPPPALATWLEARDPAEDIGLARARSWQADAWVALVAHPLLDLGRQPRVAALGDALSFPAQEGASLRAVSPTGLLERVDAGPTEVLRLDEPGEWLVEALLDDRVAGRFVVYVDMEPPGEPLVPPPGRAPADPGGLARLLLDEVRASFELPPWQWDPLLGQLALAWLDEPELPVAQRATQAGFLMEEADTWRCVAPSVNDCVSRWAYSTTERPRLLREVGRSAGLAARVLDHGEVEVGVLLPR